jgi:phosphoribosylformylglycinamidine synthase
MADACRALGIPVVSGNVSLYNESEGEAVYPTPVVGMVGVIPDVTKAVAIRPPEGAELYLLSTGHEPTLAASEWLSVMTGEDAGRPPMPDLDAEKRLHDLLRQGIREGWILSAHDVSEGGLAVALAEGGIGPAFNGAGTDAREPSVDAYWWGEESGRVVVSLATGRFTQLEIAAKQANAMVWHL